MRLARELAAGRPLVRVGFYIAAVLAHLQAVQGLTVCTGRMAQTGGRWYEKGVDEFFSRNHINNLGEIGRKTWTTRRFQGSDTS